jgi:hypothetical protein
MALNSGLFQSDEQDAQDLQTSRGWTIDDQRPGMFDNSLLAIPRALGQAGANIVGAGAKALESPDDLFSFIGNPLGQAATAVHNFQHPKPSPTTGVLPDVEKASREYAASLVPDPRVTGTGANLIQGFGRAAAEFTAGTLAGGPGLGAAAIGLSEGHAKYNDLLAEGVDDATASRAASVEALSQGAGALMPFGLPAKWLAGMSGAGAFLTQTLAGAGLNTALNASSRYASAQILDQAGYHEMAEKQKPFDTMNILADAALGAAFGAHHAWGELGEHVDPSVVDAAKTVQDGQAVAERAPGVPVDLRAEAVNRQALEKSLSDLMAGKPVDLTGVDIDGAEFARRPDLETPEARAIMADEFKNSGVLDDAEALDRWLSGETDEKPIGVRGAAEADVSPMEGSEELHPDAENLNAAARGAAEADVSPMEGSKPAEEAHPDSANLDNVARSFADDGTIVSTQNPQFPGYVPAGARMQIDGKPVWEMSHDEMQQHAIDADARDIDTLKAAFDNEEDAKKFLKLAESESDSAYHRSEAMLKKLSSEKQALVEKWETNSSYMSGKDLRDIGAEIKDIPLAESPEELGRMLSNDITAVGDKSNPRDMDRKEIGAYLRLKEGLRVARERGWDTTAISQQAIKIAAKRFYDPADAAYMLKRYIRDGEEGPLADRPNLKVPDDEGQSRYAAGLLEDANTEASQANQEADTMFNAAVDCEGRRGASFA